MNAARWQCNLHPSLRARFLVLAGLLLAGVAFWWKTWPGHWVWLQGAAQVMLLWEGWRNLQRLAARQGTLQYESTYCWRWQGEVWKLTQPMHWLPWGVLMVMRSDKGKVLRWWLMHDNMAASEWRTLRARCLWEN